MFARRLLTAVAMAATLAVGWGGSAHATTTPVGVCVENDPAQPVHCWFTVFGPTTYSFIAVSATGHAHGEFLAISGTGDASTHSGFETFLGDAGSVSISGTGTATAHTERYALARIAVSGGDAHASNGPAVGDTVAIAVTGDAQADGIAVSGTGNANGGFVGISVLQTVEGLLP